MGNCQDSDHHSELGVELRFPRESSRALGVKATVDNNTHVGGIEVAMLKEMVAQRVLGVSQPL